MKTSSRHTIIIAAVILAIIVTSTMRWGNLRTAAVDNDEAVYSVLCGLGYAKYIKDGQIGQVLSYGENREHPLLIKLLFGFAILIGDATESLEKTIFNARMMSLSLTAVHSAILLLLTPLSAFFLGLHSWQIYYSSKGWLDSGASLFATLAIFFFYMSRNKWNWKMILSAVCLGLAFGSKYINAVTAVTILPFLVYAFRKDIKYIPLYIGISLVTFYISDPVIWLHPARNFTASLNVHSYYSDSVYREQFGRDPVVWQRLAWLWKSHSVYYTPPLTFLRLDRLIFILSVLGLPFLFRKSRLLFTWYWACLLFILIYPVKWPQYTLFFIPAMCISAGSLVEGGYLIARSFQHYKKKRKRFSFNNWDTWASDARNFLLKVAMVCFVVCIGIYILNVKTFNPERSIDYSKGHNLMGKLLLSRGEYDAAEAHFKKALTGSAKVKAAGYSHLGQLYMKQERYDEATKALENALKISPNKPEALTLLGNIYLERGDREKAMEMYQKAAGDRFQRLTGAADVYGNMGLSFIMEEKYDKAVEMYKKGLEINPHSAVHHNYLGIAYFKMGQLTEAEKELKKSVGYDPHYGDAYRNLGVLYATQKHYEKAIKEFERALKINKNDEKARAYLERAIIKRGY